jgi:hypothetical protein
MVGHNHEPMKRESLAVAPKASLKRYDSCFRRQNPTMLSAERCEDGFVVALKVRQVTAVLINAIHNKEGVSRKNLHARGDARVHREFELRNEKPA